MFRFFFDREGLRSCRLHAECRFKRLDAGSQSVVGSSSTGVGTVHSLDQFQLPRLHVAVAARPLQIGNRLLAGQHSRSLMEGRQEVIGVDLCTSVGQMGRDHDEAR